MEAVGAALSRAIRSAHSVLFRANEALPTANWRAGVSFVALQEDQLYIAQAGPSLVMVSHPKTVDQYPADPDSPVVPLGGTERPQIELYRTTIEPGSMVLLAQSSWLAQIPPEALAVAAAAERVALTVEYLGQLVGTADLSAMAIGVNRRIPEVVDEPVVELPASRPQEPVVTPPPPPRPPVAPPVSIPEPVEPEPDEVTEVVEEVENEPTEEAGLADPYDTSYEEPRRPRARSLFGGRTREPVEETDYEEDYGDSGGSSKASSYDSSDYEPVDVADDDEYWADDSDAPRRSVWPLVLAVVVVPLLIAAVVLGMLWMRSKAADEEFQTILSRAGATITEANSITDDATARMRLSDARDALDQARALRPDDAQLAALLEQYQARMDQINKVTPLYGVVPLWSLDEEGRRPVRIARGGDSLYILDVGRDLVDRFVLSQLGDAVTPAEETAVLQKGQTVGDTPLANLVDITWVEAVGNQRSRLVALDLTQGLTSYDVTWGAQRLPVAGREQWGKADLIRGYAGNLYVVDTKANQIWRYRPGETGYENTPEPYFATGAAVDLAGVQSMSIDGDIWLLYTDGRLLDFNSGAQRAFELKGAPDAFSIPTSVSGAARRGPALHCRCRHWAYPGVHEGRSVPATIPPSRRRCAERYPGYVPGRDERYSLHRHRQWDL